MPSSLGYSVGCFHINCCVMTPVEEGSMERELRTLYEGCTYISVSSVVILGHRTTGKCTCLRTGSKEDLLHLLFCCLGSECLQSESAP